MPTAETLLIFRIAGIACAVPAESVGSIVMPPNHLTHPPGSGRSTPGIFHHAEYTYSVIDLNARFGIDVPRKGSGRLLLQNEGIRHFAFLVDEVVGLVRSEDGQWAKLPPYLPNTVFWSGFLYRKEIVLCTELSSLRTMHDASPLRLHIETLQQQAAANKPAEEEIPAAERQNVAQTETADRAKSAPHDSEEEQPRTVPERPAEKRAPAPVTLGKVQTTNRATPSKPQPPAAAASDTQKPATRPAAAHKPTPGPITRTTRPSASGTVSKPERPPLARPESGQASTPAPAPEPVAPVKPSQPARSTPPPSGFPVFPIILLLLLIAPAAWWFWPQQAAKHPFETTSVTPTPPARQPERKSALTTEPPEVKQTVTTTMPPVTAEPDENPPVTEPTPAATPAPVTTQAMPLTIERDASGTINLIIDRQAIANSTDVRVPVLPRPEPADSAEVATADNPAQPPSDDENPAPVETPGGDHAAQTATQTTAEQEAPLQPDPDWPKPASPTGLEPCDCTHTVVRGDTLWDIAEQYTGNAFNYHDLARRSGIRNPDKIYPGNKVRIIIR